MSQTLKREHKCMNPECSARIQKSLRLKQSTPGLVVAANMYLRTWLKIADERCAKCRKPEYTAELELFEAHLSETPSGPESKLVEPHLLVVPSSQELEQALMWAAKHIERLNLRIVENPIEQLKAIAAAQYEVIMRLENTIRSHAVRLDLLERLMDEEDEDED